jgi:hypothetical protein
LSSTQKNISSSKENISNNKGNFGKILESPFNVQEGKLFFYKDGKEDSLDITSNTVCTSDEKIIYLLLKEGWKIVEKN